MGERFASGKAGGGMAVSHCSAASMSSCAYSILSTTFARSLYPLFSHIDGIGFQWTLVRIQWTLVRIQWTLVRIQWTLVRIQWTLEQRG
jgi:hypothetical protein